MDQPGAAPAPGAAPLQPAKIPIPDLQPFMQNPGEVTDIRNWMLQFDLYLTCVQRNNRGTQQLDDADKNTVLCTYLGTEGLRQFSRNPNYARMQDLNYDVFKQHVIDQFRKRKTVFRARHDFNHRCQEQGESIADYLTCLRSMAADCDWADDDDMIRSQLVSGTNDVKAKTELFSRQDHVNLNIVIAILQASETAREDVKKLESGPPPEVKRLQSRAPGRLTGGRGRANTGQPRGSQPQQKCTACGSNSHRAKDRTCPARGQTCSRCGGPNHFASCCRANLNRRAPQPQSPRTQAAAFDSTVGSVKPVTESLVREIFQIFDGENYIPVEMMVNTGASASLMSISTYRRWFQGLQFHDPEITLKSVDGSPIKNYYGFIITTVRFGGQEVKDKLHLCGDSAGNVIGTNFLHPLGAKVDLENFSVKVGAVQKASYLKNFHSLTTSEMGLFKGQPHHIKLRHDAVPCSARLRPIPMAHKEAATKEIQKMDQLGIWEPVDKSEWVHPLVTVPKKDGSVRITTDLTKLNEYVIPDRFPIPRIKDLILNMVGSRVFSKIDLKKGYFHIFLHKDSRHLTTTITPLGLRQYLRLPMGLKDSASAFQKRVQQTLINLEGVEVYVDDIIIHGRTQGEHDQRLYAALKVLNDNDFRLAQEEKLHFSEEMIPAFGFIISAEGVKPDPANVQPILEADPPKTIKQLQRFLGMINYFLEFLKDSAPITEPLRKLTRMDQRFEWGPEQELAFKTLKAMIAEKTQLQIFNPEAKTFLTTDASDVGIGAVLSQKASANDLEVPVAFYNMTLDSAQRNYAANEKEALACVRACEHFEHFLIGRHFTLRTDHQALKTILSSPKSTRQSSKFLRWKQRLDEFDFTVEYLPGPANQVADYLSRLKDRAQQLKVQAASGEITTVTAEQIKEATKQDDELQTVIKTVEEKGKLSHTREMAPYESSRASLHYSDGILYKAGLIVVPSSLRQRILHAAHSGHPGMVRLKAILRTTYWWPGMSDAVDRHVKECGLCQRSSKSKPAVGKKETRIPFPEKAGAQWAVDITGPFPNGQSIVVAIDYWSRFPEMLATKDTSTASIVKWLQGLWDRYGNPTALVTDNGPQFISRNFQQFLKSHDIHHFTTAVYNPRENGLVESFNRYLKFGIQTFQEGEWVDGLKRLLYSYRMTPTRGGKSPADLFFGRTVRPDWKPNTTKPWRLTRRQQTGEPEQAPQAQPFTGFSRYRMGHKVLVRIPWVPKGQSPWKGPLTVKRPLGTYTYLLDDNQTWHERNLKPWTTPIQRAEYLDDTPAPQVPPRQEQRLRRSKRIRRPPKRYNFE